MERDLRVNEVELNTGGQRLKAGLFLWTSPHEVQCSLQSESRLCLTQPCEDEDQAAQSVPRFLSAPPSNLLLKGLEEAVATAGYSSRHRQGHRQF